MFPDVAMLMVLAGIGSGGALLYLIFAIPKKKKIDGAVFVSFIVLISSLLAAGAASQEARDGEASHSLKDNVGAGDRLAIVTPIEEGQFCVSFYTDGIEGGDRNVSCVSTGSLLTLVGNDLKKPDNPPPDGSHVKVVFIGDYHGDDWILVQIVDLD